MKPRHKRIIFAVFAVAAIGVASMLVVTALRSNMAYSFPPTKVLAGEVSVGQTFRLAGMVRDGTLVRHGDSLESEFIVTDNEKDLKVSYTGILPDLFKEGQGTVAKGKLGPDGIFYAEEVLAKHDESYMPPEVADVMKPKGIESTKPSQGY